MYEEAAHGSCMNEEIRTKNENRQKNVWCICFEEENDMHGDADKNTKSRIVCISDEEEERNDYYAQNNVRMHTIFLDCFMCVRSCVYVPVLWLFQKIRKYKRERIENI